jgi:hypothetical protein
LVAGLRRDWIVAPLVIDGAMNGSTFLSYVELCLVPTLHRGDIVINRQSSSAQGGSCDGCDRSCRREGSLLAAVFNGSQSNRTALQQIKAMLRKAAERTVAGLLRKIRSLLRAIRPDECSNFFRHASYASK